MGWRIIAVAVLMWSATATALENKPKLSPTQQKDVVSGNQVFATVNGQVIKLQTFFDYFQRAKRRKFYHGSVPADELKKFKRQVADTLVERVLLTKAARKQGIRPDTKAVESKLKQFDQRYSKRAGWKKMREQVFSSLRDHLSQDSLIEQLQDNIKNIPKAALSDARIIAFYKKNPDKFTTPERMRMSLILLKVAPSSASPVWQAAYLEAERIIKKLKKGADFAELARIHSGDRSAKNGGDMGYVHEGMLAPAIQKKLKTMQVGELSEPVVLLQGVAILQLKQREEPKLNDFSAVKTRARELWARSERDRIWKDYIKKLRNNSSIQINESYL